MAGNDCKAERVATRIANYRPAAFSEEVARFARAVVADASPNHPERAKSLLWAVARLGSFARSIGLDLRPEAVFHPAVIERFVIVEADTMSSPVRRTLRTNLRHVAARVAPTVQHLPAPVALSRERAKNPYTDAEITAYLALADAQPTVARALRLSGLICLGAGAGLVGKDLRHVRGSDISCRSGGVLVEVKGTRPRVVPVLTRYHDRVLAASSFAGDGYLVGGRNPDRRNVTNRLVASVAGGEDLPPLDTGRLRATWLTVIADHLGLKTFMAAAGITCSQRLGDIISTLEVCDEPGAVDLLGGAR